MVALGSVTSFTCSAFCSTNLRRTLERPTNLGPAWWRGLRAERNIGQDEVGGGTKEREREKEKRKEKERKEWGMGKRVEEGEWWGKERERGITSKSLYEGLEPSPRTLWMPTLIMAPTTIRELSYDLPAHVSPSHMCAISARLTASGRFTVSYYSWFE